MNRTLAVIAAALLAGAIGPGVSLLDAQAIPLEQLLAPGPTEEECERIYPLDDGSESTADHEAPEMGDHVDDPIVRNLVELNTTTSAIDVFLRRAREDARRFIDSWSELAEEGPEGEIHLKEGAFEKLFSESTFQYDCILQGAQRYYDLLTGREYTTAVNASLLVAGRLQDALQDEVENAETEENRTSYEFLLDDVERRKAGIESGRDRLRDELEGLNERIQNLREKKKHVIYALLIDNLRLAEQRLKDIANDVAQFSRLVEQVAEQSGRIGL